MTGKGKDGYVLGYFMVLLMVLMILLTSVMTMSFGYYSRILNEKYRKQAFYTARSVAAALADEIVYGEKSGLTETVLDQLFTGEETEILGLPEEMGRCILRIEHDEDEDILELKVTVTLKNQEQTVEAVLHRQGLMGDETSSPDEYVWKLLGYRNGENGNGEILEE